MKKLARFFLLLVTISSLASCAVSGGYWVPPSSPPTQVPPLPPASLSSSQTVDDPGSDFEPTASGPMEPAVIDPFPTLELMFIDPVVSPTQPPDLSLIPTPTSTPEIYVVNTAPILYYAQAADTLRVVAIRFGVKQDEITSPEPIPPSGFINPGQLLIIPRRLTNTTASRMLIPDSEVVYSPSAVSFDAIEFASQAGGYLSSFREWHRSTGNRTGAEIVERVALENSINPRLLLALLEFHSHWVYEHPDSPNQTEYPLGHIDLKDKGLYNQLVWTVNQLSIGYYAYREGRLTDIQFSDGARIRLAPDLNAGTAALQYYFAQLYDSADWLQTLDMDTGFPYLFAQMFGDPWERARTVEPLFPLGITQPPLTLPFSRNWTWSYTGGPHGAWEHDGAYAALDFAPGAAESGCIDTPAWAVAAAAGLVVRTGPGLVVVDLDGDGHEQTGWVLIYLHLAEKGRVQQGTWVSAGDPLGHPSCEGGVSTGTHLHFARKFNGEWVPADGPLPFNLGGWIAHAGPLAYKGTLTRDSLTLEACTCSNYKTFITRTESDP
jgi:LasA protease